MPCTCASPAVGWLRRVRDNLMETSDQEVATAATEPNRDVHAAPVRKLVVGLGNPGREYETTRHNVGFRVVDELARRHGGQWQELCRSSFMSIAPMKRTVGSTSESTDIILDLAKPQTYMNRSGLSVRCLQEQYAYEVANILVVFDEIALPLGVLRLRSKGSTAGHRGLASVIHHVRTERIARLRVGILPERAVEEDLPDFVLAPFTDAERSVIESEILRAADCCQTWALDGPSKAMNEYNGKVSEAEGQLS